MGIRSVGNVKRRKMDDQLNFLCLSAVYTDLRSIIDEENLDEEQYRKRIKLIMQNISQHMICQIMESE
jgi:hypothetical protein